MATVDSGAAQAAGKSVLFVAGRLVPDGPCRAIVSLARRLNELGHKVEMVCRSGSIAGVYPRDRGRLASEHNPPVWLSRALANNLRGRFSLRGLVARARELAPDIVHVHGAALAGVAARLARRLRKPYVLGIGDFLAPGESVRLSKRFIGKIIVTSDAIRVDLVNRAGLPRGVIEVVPDGVEVMPARAAAGSRVPVIGTTGRLVESGGQEYFIRAAHLLAMRGRNAQFLIAGDGPER